MGGGASIPPDDDEGRSRTEHARKRADEAKTNPNRQVGDANRVIREGRRFLDSDTGYTVHVLGDRVVITRPGGQIQTQFVNTRANTASRVASGRWIPQ